MKSTFTIKKPKGVDLAHASTPMYMALLTTPLIPVISCTGSADSSTSELAPARVTHRKAPAVTCGVGGRCVLSSSSLLPADASDPTRGRKRLKSSTGSGHEQATPGGGWGDSSTGGGRISESRRSKLIPNGNSSGSTSGCLFLFSDSLSAAGGMGAARG